MHRILDPIPSGHLSECVGAPLGRATAAALELERGGVGWGVAAPPGTASLTDSQSHAICLTDLPAVSSETRAQKSPG